jgi:hypothetical protein
MTGFGRMTQQVLTSRIPTSVTKQLKIATAGDARKLRVSSNFLPVFGFDRDTRIKVESFNGGVKVMPLSDGSQKIYSREYNYQL